VSRQSIGSTALPSLPRGRRSRWLKAFRGNSRCIGPDTDVSPLSETDISFILDGIHPQRLISRKEGL
jgi:hypothetical protein